MASSNFVLHQVGGKTSRVAVPLTPLEPNKVRVKITHSGFCDTDHSFMPLGIALGHEGVGLVEKIGNLVMEVKIGDRVGGGYYRNVRTPRTPVQHLDSISANITQSCGKCKYCTNGHEMWCYSRTMYGESDTDNGTFSNYFIANETFLYKIPKSMSSEDATPIQFARATTYSALADKVNGGDCVGIVGIGGLGHLAIQFASNLGATVVAISYSRNKEADARAFGAHEFFLLDELENMRFPLDILLLTGSEFPLFEK
jgi:D-arabinose 1-dehydrogenase-like Zn-dependent alcohol dehydrogenase